MRRLLFVLLGLLAAAPPVDGRDVGTSWAGAEVARLELEDGWSPLKGGVRVRVYDAVHQAGGGLGCKISLHASPAAAGRCRVTETLALRFFDNRGRLLGDRPGIGFHVGPAWKGGKLDISLGTSPPPAGTAAISIELESFKVETSRLRLPPAPGK
jgi:hypothetical protein